MHRLLHEPLHSGQTCTPHSSRMAPAGTQVWGGCLSVSFRSRLARAMCWRRLPEPSLWACVSVFTVPPSFSMNPTGKHSCACLHFFRTCTRFFHVLQMMSMVYFLSRLPRWVQGTAPGRMLTFAHPHMYLYVLYAELSFMPRAALWNGHDGRLQWPRETTGLSSSFLHFPEARLLLAGIDTPHCSHTLPPCTDSGSPESRLPMSPRPSHPSRGALLFLRSMQTRRLIQKILPQSVLNMAMLGYNTPLCFSLLTPSP